MKEIYVVRLSKYGSDAAFLAFGSRRSAREAAARIAEVLSYELDDPMELVSPALCPEGL